MDPCIGFVQVSAPTSDIVMAMGFSLVLLVILRLTSAKWIREARKNRITERLLGELDKIKSKGGELTAYDAMIMETFRAAVKGDFGVDDETDEDDERREDRSWWKRWMRL